MTSPILTIWTRPRSAIRQVVEGGRSWPTLVLACVAGVADVVATMLARSGGGPPSWRVLPGAVMLGGALGLAWLWLLAGTVHFCGRWLGGTATKPSLRSALAWGSVPTGAALPILIAGWLLLDWIDCGPEAGPTVNALRLAVGALAVASLALRSQTVAEVQGFRSAWRGLGNLLLAVAIIWVPLMLFFVGFYLIFAARLR